MASSRDAPNDGLPQLHRALGVVAITVYAIGDVLGAGIYALVGKVVAEAGSAAPLSFLTSALIALLTGLTYAELSSRFPFAGGAASYCRRAFSYPLLAFVIGILVLASGISSAATISRAMVGYLQPFLDIPTTLGSLGLLALLSWLNHRGIRESARVNFTLTAIEVLGLVLILAVAARYARGLGMEEVAARATPVGEWSGVLSGATVAFFAYIGFEDTANMAEEVRDPSRALPRAILTAIGFACVLYVAVTVAALITAPLDVLSASGAPLLEVLNVAGVRLPGSAFALIALVAICNTGLINLIMASRLMYGMAREGLMPAVLGSVHPRRRTPWVAVWTAFVLAAGFALSGGVEVLAKTTSLLLLIVFAVLHLGLIRVKRTQVPPAPGIFTTPRWTPVAGAALSAFLAAQYPFEVYARTLAVLAAAAVLYAAMSGARRPH